MGVGLHRKDLKEVEKRITKRLVFTFLHHLRPAVIRSYRYSEKPYSGLRPLWLSVLIYGSIRRKSRSQIQYTTTDGNQTQWHVHNADISSRGESAHKLRCGNLSIREISQRQVDELVQPLVVIIATVTQSFMHKR